MSLKLQIDKPIEGFESRSLIDRNSAPLTAASVWRDLDGGITAAGELISDRTALSISTVTACVSILAYAVASLPCKLLERTDRGKIEIHDDPLGYLLSAEPNPDMSAFVFWATMIGSSALTGNGYAQIMRDNRGEPTGIWPLHPWKTEPIRGTDGRIAFKTSDGMREGQFRVIPGQDVLHFPLFSLDGLKGISPVTAARETFALAKAAEKFGSRYFVNGANSTVALLGPEVDQKIQDGIVNGIRDGYSGANANKPIILFGDWDVKSLSLSPEDSQFLSTRAFQRTEIAALFNISPAMVGDTSRLSNANHEQFQLSFVTDTLRPILVRIEQECRRKLLRNRPSASIMFDVRERLRGDFGSLVKALADSINNTMMTPNEAREILGLPRFGPEGDKARYPVNMAPITEDRLLSPPKDNNENQ